MDIKKGFIMKLESVFQKELINELKELFPGCMIMKTDPGYIQGIPGILILFNNRWALLECKRDARSKHQPNQDYYVDRLNKMSYSAFIYPENKEVVINELQHALYS